MAPTVETGSVYQITGMLDTRYDPPRVIITVEPLGAPAPAPTERLPVTRAPAAPSRPVGVREAPAPEYRPPRPQPAPPGSLEPVPDRRPIPQLRGRVEIEGEVLSIRYVDRGHGRIPKMTVRHAEGWEVTGTVPATIAEVKRGDRVRFLARLEASPSDPARGEFHRPTRAVIL